MTEDSYTPLAEIKASSSEIKACAFSAWYHTFKKYTPKAHIIHPLPQEFIKYLAQDGIRLSLEENDSSFYDSCLKPDDDNDYSDWEDNQLPESESDEESEFTNKKKEEEEEEMVPIVNFPDLHKEISDVIREYGAVTPKLNWSAPRDATWILPNNTSKCIHVNDVYLLLNASNYIAYDLDHAFDECEDKVDPQSVQYELILRKWFDINPALEFRVFIRDGEICGISQRDLNYYNYLEPLQDTFTTLIEDFVHDVVLPKFELSCFVLDVYLPRPFVQCWIIDINPWSRTTDPLLFSWSELASKNLEAETQAEIRLITEHNIGRFVTKEHSENHVPKDIVTASLDPESLRELTYKWKEILKMQEEDAESDDD